MALIDSHCHLDMFPAEERDAVIERAHAAGVDTLVSIGTRLGQSRALVRALAGQAGVWCTVGVHPNHVHEEPIATVEAIVALTGSAGVIGIGESGLDYFYKRGPKADQQESFRRHIRAAQQTGLPLVIHARDADEDIAAILEEEWARGGPFRPLLHCFSSGRALAETALRLGGYVSLSGMLTFPKLFELREIAADLPLDRLLVETDAPFLAPVPFRGKRNEPAYVVHTATALAALRGMEPAELAAQTSANFRRLFERAAAA